MDNPSFQTSFIPKKPLAETPAPVVVIKSHPFGILSFVSVIFFIAMVAAAGGLYFYKGILVGQISGFQKSLASAKGSFEPETIADLQLFDKRVGVPSQIIANHVVFSPLFVKIGELTI